MNSPSSWEPPFQAGDRRGVQSTGLSVAQVLVVLSSSPRHRKWNPQRPAPDNPNRKWLNPLGFPPQTQPYVASPKSLCRILSGKGLIADFHHKSSPLVALERTDVVSTRSRCRILCGKGLIEDFQYLRRQWEELVWVPDHCAGYSVEKV